MLLDTSYSGWQRRSDRCTFVCAEWMGLGPAPAILCCHSGALLPADSAGGSNGNFVGILPIPTATLNEPLYLRLRDRPTQLPAWHCSKTTQPGIRSCTALRHTAHRCAKLFNAPKCKKACTYVKIRAKTREKCKNYCSDLSQWAGRSLRHPAARCRPGRAAGALAAARDRCARSLGSRG